MTTSDRTTWMQTRVNQTATRRGLTSLRPALLVGLLMLALSPTAQAASFTETQTLTDWGPGFNSSPAAAPGYLGWASADAIHINAGTIPAAGSGLKIAPGGTAGWTASDGPP